MPSRPLALVRGSLFPPVRGGEDSLLLADGLIRIVGREADVRRAHPRAEVIDLEGRTVLPGFHDAHFHFFESGLVRSRPSLEHCRSLEDFADAVREADRAAPGPAVLFLEGWDQNAWEDRRLPNRTLMDRATGARPAFASRVCGHVAVANTSGVELLERLWPGEGIDPDTGVLLEGPALALEEMIPPDPEESATAFAEAARSCLSLGITTTCDFLRPHAARGWRDQLARGELDVRVNAYVFEECLDEPGLLETLPATDRFRVRGVKLFADGSIGGRTAALFDDYADRPGERGLLIHGDDSLRASIRRGHDRGLAVAVHAIGDRAIAQVLDAFATLPPDEIRERRHRVEHLELPRAGDLDRLAHLGVRPCMQPNFVGRYGAPGGLYETALGAERLRRMNPFRSALTRDTGVFFGSDGMPASPAFGIRAAEEHPVEAERLTREEAVRLYTEAAARAVRGDDRSGRLAAGADADIVVLAAESDEVDLTITAGRIVFRRGSS